MRHDRGIEAIAIFKFVKAALLVGIGIGAFSLLHHDVAGTVARWIAYFPIDPGNHFVHLLLQKLGVVDDRRLEEVGAGTFFYALLLLLEGTGLYLEKSWAEYLTVILTASFIPFEVYELAMRFRPFRIIALLVNVAIVWYLLVVIRRNRRRRAAASTASA
jgi:uncharacterized membrane protein (DUF2068 family)